MVRSFTPKTDHKPLFGLVKKKEVENERLTRLLPDLWDYAVEYVPGVNNIDADYISRKSMEKFTLMSPSDVLEIATRFSSRVLPGTALSM